MKKIITLILSALLIFSCAFAPNEKAGIADITTTNEIGDKSEIVVKVNVTQDSRGGISVIEKEVTGAIITITSPDGTTESKTWQKSGTNRLTFTSQGPGSYLIGVTETDSAGNSSSYEEPFQVKMGINTILSITPGSNIFVDINPIQTTGHSFMVEVASSPEGTGTISATSTANGIYKPGTIITVEAVSDLDNNFIGWFDATTKGNLISRDTVYNFALKSDTKLYAKFISNNYIVNFTDPLIDEKIRTIVSKPTGSLTYSDVKNITRVSKTDLVAGQSINSLSGLEYLTNLTTLNFSTIYSSYKGGITDLTPLKNLTALTSLTLSKNKISDLTPLTDLNALTYLNLSYNEITDITPLKNLTSLDTIYLSHTPIVDISPLSNLTNITKLWLGSCRIKDISPLASMTKVQEIALYSNEIADITPLANLTTLTSLRLGAIRLTDISPLANLTNLDYLNIAGNQINDISPLANLKKLTMLYCESNQVVDISPLSSLTELIILDISINKIQDLSALSNLTKINHLSTSHNQLKSITALVNLTNLTTIRMMYNNLTDISPLLNNTGLSTGDRADIITGNTIPQADIDTLKTKGVTVN